MPVPQRTDYFAGQPAGTTELAQVLTVLCQIERHLAIIAAGGHGLGPGRPIAAVDAEVLALYLPVLGEGLGSVGRAFTAAEALTLLKQQIGRVEIGAKALGKLFSRCLDIPVAGFRIRRYGSLRGATIWRVWRV